MGEADAVMPRNLFLRDGAALGTADPAIQIGEALLEHLGIASVLGGLDLLKNAGAGEAKGFTALTALEFLR